MRRKLRGQALAASTHRPIAVDVDAHDLGLQFDQTTEKVREHFIGQRPVEARDLVFSGTYDDDPLLARWLLGAQSEKHVIGL